jgi:hypothetical protein
MSLSDVVMQNVFMLNFVMPKVIVLRIILLNIIVLGVVMLKVIVLSSIRLNVVLLNVVAPAVVVEWMERLSKKIFQKYDWLREEIKMFAFQLKINNILEAGKLILVSLMLLTNKLECLY